MALRTILVLALLASCGNLPARPAPPELRTSLPLQYRASLVSQAPAAPEAREPGVAASERRIEVQFVVHSCSAREAEAQLGALALGPTAWMLDEEDATRLLATVGELVMAPRLTVFDGLRSHFAVAGERAYVSRFELSGDGTTLVADPVVDTLALGMSFDLCARVAQEDTGEDTEEDTVELELEWRLCELDEELPELAHALPFGDTSVRLQVPLAMNQQLTTHARLRAGECMVLSCRGADGRQRLAVVSARAIDSDAR